MPITQKKLIIGKNVPKEEGTKIWPEKLHGYSRISTAYVIIRLFKT